MDSNIACDPNAAKETSTDRRQAGEKPLKRLGIVVLTQVHPV
jgi:hypothetical protein